MRYEKGHKDATRARIVEIAARRFRAEGIEGVGIAGLMADAGLTHGGFYSHFASKEALVQAALGDAFQRTQLKLDEAAGTGATGLQGIVRFYLRPHHRDEPEGGCPAAALTSEIARHPATIRRVFTDRIEDRIALIADHLPDVPPEARHRRSIAIFAAIMGALQLARAVGNPALSDEILASGAEAALALAGPAAG